MNKREAHHMADFMENNHPCLKVMMIANGVGMLRERKLPIPAWTLPSQSWVVLFRHEGSNQPLIIPVEGDEAVCYALQSTGVFQDFIGPGDEWCFLEDWFCYRHEKTEGAA